LYLSQIGSIFTSIFSIIFGIVGIYGYKAFYYYEQKRITFSKIRHPEKEFGQKIGRFISLFLWYFSVVISRILLIALLSSYKPYLISVLILFILIKSLILNSHEKKYFEQTIFIKEFEKESTDFRELYLRQGGLVAIEKLIYFKQKSVLKSILSFFYMIFGVYENIFINIEYDSDNFYIPRQTKNYIFFYVFFYIENIIFAIILYFAFNNNLRIIFFYVFTFPISVLIQILYRRVDMEEEVSFYFCIFMNKSKNIDSCLE
jgi:4-hydroxybenzoate polyprenyltransferase